MQPTQTQDQACRNKIDKIKRIAAEVGGNVYENYSGRGMFGEKCFGIVCPNANECLEVAGAHGLRGGNIDNMGRDFIVYWPGVR